MRPRFIYIVILAFLIPNFVFAGQCSKTGYTILTINGMSTTNKKAVENRDALKVKLKSNLKIKENFEVDYLLNPSHIAGLGDITDVITQKIHEYDVAVPDYDLVEMWKTASEKVRTQKLLLVGHSQGNFYTNTFYKVLTGSGGVSNQALGVYGVASPASFVAGDGLYTTSDTDRVINDLRGDYLTILPANAKIKLLDQDISTNGHSFSDIYLKYQGDKIISEIKYLLKGLQANENKDGPCIFPPELDLTHKITGKVLAVADPLAIGVRTAGQESFRFASAFGNKVLAMLGGKNPNPAAVVLATEETSTETTETTPPESKVEKPKPAVAEVAVTPEP